MSLRSSLAGTLAAVAAALLAAPAPAARPAVRAAGGFHAGFHASGFHPGVYHPPLGSGFRVHAGAAGSFRAGAANLAAQRGGVHFGGYGATRAYAGAFRARSLAGLGAARYGAALNARLRAGTANYRAALGGAALARYRAAYLGGAGALGRYGRGFGLGYGGFGYGGLGYGGLASLYAGAYGLGYGLGDGGYLPWYYALANSPGFDGYTSAYYPYDLYDYGVDDLDTTPALTGSAYYAPEEDLTPATPPPVPAQAATDDRAHLTVIVPPGARLWFNGTAVAGAGPRREFYSPPLTPGQDYLYQVRARWVEEGHPLDRVRTVHVQANSWNEVDMTRPEPGDTTTVP
jgi:uncharacterized protein (TIGR03000 family)